MGKYKHVSHTTKNEHHEEEVEIEYEKTFLQWLFNRPPTKQVFVGGGTVWYNKDSGERAGTDKEYEICCIVALHFIERK